MTLFGKNTAFDKLLEKATSHLLLEPDWASNINACDMVRQGEVSGKYAVVALKKKLSHSNPHVVMYSLNLVEAMAKNCGSIVHDEIATQDFMNQMKNLVKEKDPVRSKVLELIQLWAHAFRHQSKYSVVQTLYNGLKASGNTFPNLIESDAMFSSENAPEWQDSDVCLHCKLTFSTLKRKHHCRNCGNVFCDDCSSKRSNLPKYGIEKDVRVCDSCFDQIKGGSANSRPMPVKKGGHVQFNEEVAVRNFQPDVKDTDSDALRTQKEKELELQEKEELELALALSASEVESHEAKQTKQAPMTVEQPSPANQSGFSSPYSTLDTSEMDPELARYLNRNYWEKKAKTTHPSAPIMPNSPHKMSMSKTADTTATTVQNKSATDSTKESVISDDQEEFLSALKSSIDIFVNRMRSNQQRGRSIALDSAVQTLFLTLNAMQPQLLQYINEQDDQRNHYENLQDKLSQIRESREALDALREEHREKRRLEEEEAARLRQIQMMQKLEVMRQKKQEFLDYQRQMAVERMHQQERDMASRLAQQKQMMQMRQYQQQYPYSMQSAMPGPESGLPPIAGQQYSNMSNNATVHYNPMQPNMPVDAYGYPMMAQYGPQPSTDYYGMQNVSHNMVHPPRTSDAAPLNYMQHGPVNNTSHVASQPNGYNMMPQPCNQMYAVQPQSTGAWEQSNQGGVFHGPPVGDDTHFIQERKEDQLISFD